MNYEGLYNWTSEELSLPLNVMVSKLVNISGQRVQFQVGGRYWVDSPDTGPEDFGLRAAVIFLFPK